MCTSGAGFVYVHHVIDMFWILLSVIFVRVGVICLKDILVELFHYWWPSTKSWQQWWQGLWCLLNYRKYLNSQFLCAFTALWNKYACQQSCQLTRQEGESIPVHEEGAEHHTLFKLSQYTSLHCYALPTPSSTLLSCSVQNSIPYR